MYIHLLCPCWRQLRPQSVTRNLNLVIRNAKAFVSGSYLVTKIVGNHHIHGLKENRLIIIWIQEAL